MESPVDDIPHQNMHVPDCDDSDVSSDASWTTEPGLFGLLGGCGKCICMCGGGGDSHTHYTVGGKCIHHQHIMDAGCTLREFDARFLYGNC